MAIAQSILPEFDHEMAGTRKTLERVPDDKLDWKAHPKCNSIGWVAGHLAEIPGWVTPTLKQDALDIAPVGGEPFRPTKFTSRKQMLEVFDKNVAAAREAIAAIVGRRLHEAVVAALGRQGDVHDAADRRSARLCDESLDSPPGLPLLVSPNERYPGPVALRSVRRRRLITASKGKSRESLRASTWESSKLVRPALNSTILVLKPTTPRLEIWRMETSVCWFVTGGCTNDLERVAHDPGLHFLSLAHDLLFCAASDANAKQNEEHPN